MNEPSLIRTQRKLLTDLVELAASRARTEAALERDAAAHRAAADKLLDEATARIETQRKQGIQDIEAEFASAKEDITARFTAEYDAAEKEYAETGQAIRDTYETGREKSKQDYHEACWSINTVFEAARATAENQFKDLERNFEGSLHRISSMQQEAKGLLKEWRQQGAYARVDVVRNPLPPDDQVMEQMEALTAESEELLARLKQLFIPRFFKGFNLIWLFVVLWGLLAVPCWLMVEQKFILAAITCTLATVVLGIGLAFWLFLVARGQVFRNYQLLRQALFDAENSRQRFLDVARADYQKQLFEHKDRRDRELHQVLKKYRALRDDIKQRRERETAQMEGKFPGWLADVKQRREQELAEAEESRQQQTAELLDRYQTDQAVAQDRHDHEVQAAATTWEQGWQDMAARWQRGMSETQAAVDTVQRECGRLFPEWSDPIWDNWTPPKDIASVLRFGSYEVDLARIPHGLVADESLQSSMPQTFGLPALVAFPERSSLLFKATEVGRILAVQAIQALMMRLLTTVPPSKVRFTIIDPVGLGENFATFMHLADYDEQLVTSRIWTEQQHIEQRLADLTGHMENVIQKYLRNQYETIEDYNLSAGEVAEPFRIVVVANFPVNFTVEAARRLVSVASSGARCGVHTLVTVDTRQPLPQGFDLRELEQSSVNLLWTDGRFIWKDADFESFPLQLDTPPDAEFSTRVLRIVGERAKEAKRVEVPFEFIAPPPEKYWTTDSRFGLNVPLGRAGATKRQQLELGRGTAQHVLVAGKTGSGKSTMMHALITNLALNYSPDEVELYLVDFKKGVEFKTYATHELPHARVIAIESEREFGLSVLQRLDFELKRRADRFRELGAQDLAACRQADPSKALPRILLLVDEFQEFFVEDDRIAQDAALLLDRLVRQGRAFGIHVLLGSQTLGGAYTLARSTIDQMAVRIALQCSEVDAHLILSEDNAAARLLSRPGEAIYNDANGLVEGNNPFQVVWLPDERREDYLQQVQELERQRHGGRFRDQIVFEGNAPANVATNPILSKLLSAPAWPKGSRAFQAWLGEAIAIKDPTAAVFRPQSGSNLMVVGQDDEAALGMLVTAMVSLASQHPPTAPATDEGAPRERTMAARFYVLDGSPADAQHAGLLPRLPTMLPHAMQVAAWRELPPLINEVNAEVERRLASHDPEALAIYLIVYGLQRFRDLRREEDDFGFSRGSEERPSPAKQFTNILREGPGVGVHVLVWCDTYNNLTRTLDRSSLREFEMRVLFQMGAGDSSNLIDTPLASKLGMHRALYYSEEQGRAEKLRPYGVPPDAWLHWACGQLNARAAGVLG
jgi:hypothetical protein